jgi:hypothetical protein
MNLPMGIRIVGTRSSDDLRCDPSASGLNDHSCIAQTVVSRNRKSLIDGEDPLTSTPATAVTRMVDAGDSGDANDGGVRAPETFLSVLASGLRLFLNRGVCNVAP